MRFWDSSAIVPLVVDEPSTAAMRRVLKEDPALIVWWGTELECISAVTRRERDGEFDASAVNTALALLAEIGQAATEVEPSLRIRQLAVRFLRVHPLRAADALQLAAATIAAEYEPATVSFVTLDERLSAAAEREGFAVVRP